MFDGLGILHLEFLNYPGLLSVEPCPPEGSLVILSEVQHGFTMKSSWNRGVKLVGRGACWTGIQPSFCLLRPCSLHQLRRQDIIFRICYLWASLVAQMVKSLPTMQENWVQPLGGEDPLEKEMSTHSSILAWKIPWTEEPDGLQSMGSQKSQN